MELCPFHTIGSSYAGTITLYPSIASDQPLCRDCCVGEYNTRDSFLRHQFLCRLQGFRILAPAHDDFSLLLSEQFQGGFCDSFRNKDGAFEIQGMCRTGSSEASVPSRGDDYMDSVAVFCLRVLDVIRYASILEGIGWMQILASVDLRLVARTRGVVGEYLELQIHVCVDDLGELI